MKNNRICQILNIEKPVIQGPLSWLTDARLVAAVSNAGGLGVLGPNAGLTAETAVSTPEETAEKMREAYSAGDKRRGRQGRGVYRLR